VTNVFLEFFERIGEKATGMRGFMIMDDFARSARMNIEAI
jgi:hypothetical protein